jgi:hypothetical protein
VFYAAVFSLCASSTLDPRSVCNQYLLSVASRLNNDGGPGRWRRQREQGRSLPFSPCRWLKEIIYSVTLTLKVRGAVANTFVPAASTKSLPEERVKKVAAVLGLKIIAL